MALTDYMTFMISRETENVSSIDDVVLAFKSLTENSERPYITRDELFAVSFVQGFDRRKKPFFVYRIYQQNKPNSVVVR